MALFACLALLSATPAEWTAAETPLEHPSALSHLSLRFERDTIHLDLRLQELTLREVTRWNLDSDLSGHISNFELEDNWDRVAAMIESELWLELDGDVRYPSFTISGYSGDRHDLADGSFDFQYVSCSATVSRPASIDQVLVHSDLFLDDGNPAHILDLEASGFGEGERRWILRGEDRDWRLDLPAKSTQLWRYTVIGWEHVLSGWDHLAFLLALLFGVRKLRSLLGAVTAFTLAHSLTLAASALGLLALSPTLVEPGIALSVLIVLALHLRTQGGHTHPWIPAFAFGLLHGFGFAGVLGDIGLPTDAKALGLLGFNLGVELGQLSFVVPVVLGAFLLGRRASTEQREQWRWLFAVPTAAFALFLVGRAITTYGLPSWSGDQATLATWGFGAAALAITVVLPGGPTPERQQWRKTAWQAALLCAFFLLGRSLRGG